MIANFLLRKGCCGFVKWAWVHLAVRSKFNVEKNDKDKHAEQEYCCVIERGGCGTGVGELLRLNMCC